MQTDCQVCDSAVSFLPTVFAIYSKIVCGLSGAAADGSKFLLSRWSQGRIDPPNSKGEAGFAFFAQ